MARGLRFLDQETTEKLSYLGSEKKRYQSACIAVQTICTLVFHMFSYKGTRFLIVVVKTIFIGLWQRTRDIIMVNEYISFVLL